MKSLTGLLITCLGIFALTAITQAQQIPNTSANENSDKLLQRHFKVDANAFIAFVAALQKTPGLQSNDVSTLARSFFSTLGVDLGLPGKSVFYGDRLGELFVRGTKSDLDTIENALEVLSRVAPQI